MAGRAIHPRNGKTIMAVREPPGATMTVRAQLVLGLQEERGLPARVRRMAGGTAALQGLVLFRLFEIRPRVTIPAEIHLGTLQEVGVVAAMRVVAGST